MNQKGFINALLIVLVVVLAGAVGYLSFTRKSERSPLPSSTPPTITITSPDGGENVTANAIDFNIGWTVSGIVDKENYYVGLSLVKNGVTLGAVSNKASSANSSGYNWGWIGVGNYLDVATNLKTAAVGNDYKIRAKLFKVGSGLIAQDESDNYFTISQNSPIPQTSITPPTPLPTICKDEPEATPVITSLSSYSGPVVTKLEIRGCNFSGFEGDKSVWIENSQGVTGFLYGEVGSTGKLLKVTLKSPLCQKDTSYSGLSCDAWLTLTPGTYKIYVAPWGKKSNEVRFIVTGTPVLPNPPIPEGGE